MVANIIIVIVLHYVATVNGRKIFGGEVESVPVSKKREKIKRHMEMY
jgi:hypothetical protein